jgi:hypothetical protein
MTVVAERFAERRGKTRKKAFEIKGRIRMPGDGDTHLRLSTGAGSKGADAEETTKLAPLTGSYCGTIATR